MLDNYTENITRRADESFDMILDEYSMVYSVSEVREKINSLKKYVGTSRYSSELKSIYKIFEMYGIKYEKRRDSSYYDQLLSENEKIFDLESKMINTICSIYKRYPTPNSYMIRLVNNLTGSGNDSDTLRVRILKKFIENGDYLKEAGFGGKTYIEGYIKNKLNKKTKIDKSTVLNNLDDGVFNVLVNATKEQKKDKGTYGLLSMIDCLASGKFKGNTGTRKALYWFAVVFEMSFCIDESREGKIKDKRTDIEDNLFRDYYSNNIMRYISPEYDGISDKTTESDPSGQGINYKNYAEIVFLYYINNDSYSTQEKIKRINETLKEIDKKAKQLNPSALYENSITRHAQSDILNVLKLSEDKLIDYLLDNYNCYSNGQGCFETEQNQETAFNEYIKLIKSLREEAGLENCNYGVWFTDIDAFHKSKIKKENFLKNHNDVKSEDLDLCITLIDKFNDKYLGIKIDENASDQTENAEHKEISRRKVEKLEVDNSRSISRTALLVAFYYYYNYCHEEDYSDRDRNFSCFYNDFKTEADKILERAFYQKICTKNIFDIFIIFSSYAWCCGIL